MLQALFQFSKKDLIYVASEGRSVAAGTQEPQFTRQ
jgi:hypothetical protein